MKIRVWVFAAIGVVCAVWACWFVYDGFVSEDYSISCGGEVGAAILEEFRMDADKLTVMEGCGDQTGSLRPGETKSVLVRGTKQNIESALASSGVPVDQVEARDESLGFLTTPAEWELARPAPRRDWAVKYSLHFSDDIAANGHNWEREFEWGPEQEGDAYLLLMVLRTGN